MIVAAGVRATLRAFLAPILRHNNLESVVDQVHFDLSVDLSRSGETRRRIHLDEPWFQIGVQKHVETVHLETVLVVNHDALHRFKTDPDNIINLVEALVRLCLALRLLKVKLQVLDRPLASMLVVVVHGLLGDRDICQMDKHILSLGGVIRVLFNAEPSETQVVKVDLQGSEVGY